MRQTLSSGLTQSTTTRIKLAWLFVVLNWVDALLTVYAVQSCLGIEGNPILSWLPLWQLVVLKMVGAVVVAGLFVGSKGILTGLNIGMGLVVLWNALVVSGS